MTATLYAARPKEGFFKVSDPGTIVIEKDGRQSFTPSAQGTHYRLTEDPEKRDKVIQAWVELASAKPVIPQRFRPPVDDKKNEKKPDTPVKQ